MKPEAFACYTGIIIVSDPFYSPMCLCLDDSHVYPWRTHCSPHRHTYTVTHEITHLFTFAVPTYAQVYMDTHIYTHG